MHHREAGLLLLGALAILLRASPAGAVTIRVDAAFEDEAPLRDRIRKAPGLAVSPEAWLTQQLVSALSDPQRGIKFMHFTADGAADYTMIAKLRHATSIPAWPKGRVALNFSIPGLSGDAHAFETTVLDNYFNEAERTSYADSWLLDKVEAEIGAGHLYSGLLEYVPIKAKANAQGDRIRTDIKYFLGYGSAVFAVRWPENGHTAHLFFVQCDDDHVGGPIVNGDPAPGEASCGAGVPYNKVPHAWDTVFLRNAWSGY
jgi:hypothetical protein